ncbi:MAG: Sec-independent protein translocase protein TatB [Devosia sp.]
MFGIGWTEMLLVGVVALIVIGPKDLPVVMNRLGKAVSAIRRMGNEFQREINKATGLDAVTDLRRSLTEPLKQTAAQIRDEFNKPLSNGSFVPSGIIAPKDPKVESVVDEIHAKVGMEPPKATAKPKPVAKPKKAKAITIAAPVESPAPIEAIAPVKAVRKPRAKATPAAPADVPLFADDPIAVKKPAAPRKPRAAKPKSEA